MSFGQRLSEERKRIGLNQTEFGRIAGVTKTSQVNYESGERSPSVDYWQAIATAGVDVQYIITGIKTATQNTALSPREAALLDNYRHVDDELDKKVIERTAFLAAKADELEATERKRA